MTNLGRLTNHRAVELEDQNYYHFYLPREEVDGLLINSGDFLVRESVVPGKSRSTILNIKFEHNIRTFPVQFNPVDNLYYFSENVGKSNVVELIEYHLENDLAIGNIHLGEPVGRKNWEILNDQVELFDRVISKGCFSTTKLGKIFLNNKEWMPMAYKNIDDLLVPNNKNEEENNKFRILREFQIGRMLRGRANVLTVHGLYIGSEKIAVLMELCNDHPPLNVYMLNNSTDVTVTEKQNYLMQAASGLSYLHKSNLLHRNFSSKKCYLINGETQNPPFVLKLGGYGFNTRIGPFYRMTTQHPYDILITPAECMGEDSIWSMKSDTWSFGVLIWDLFEDCKSVPYEDSKIDSVANLKAFLKHGCRLKPNETMPEECRLIMNECFDDDPKKRPEMADVYKRFNTLTKPIVDKLAQSSNNTEVSTESAAVSDQPPKTAPA